MDIATQSFGWSQLAERAGLDRAAVAGWATAQAAEAGLAGWEPILPDPEEARAQAEAARARGLAMRSFYMGGVLHDPAVARDTIAGMLAIGKVAASAGGRLAVVNPNPIAWGGQADKDDAALTFQAAQLTALAQSLREVGVTLCYHAHDPEMRAAAREFHHMLLATDPDLVRLCLDPHWIWRGAGRSQVALTDIVRLYGDRVEVVHVRQSHGDVWAQAVGEGDLDYRALVAELAAKGPRPHLVVENALESGTPDVLTPVEAHRRSRLYVEEVFAPLAPDPAPTLAPSR